MISHSKISAFVTIVRRSNNAYARFTHFCWILALTQWAERDKTWFITQSHRQTACAWWRYGGWVLIIYTLFPTNRFPYAPTNKKLSCRWETARCFVSLDISQSHSRSYKVIRNDPLEYDACKSLLVFHCNYVCTSHRFWDIQRQIIG